MLGMAGKGSRLRSVEDAKGRPANGTKRNRWGTMCSGVALEACWLYFDLPNLAQLAFTLWLLDLNDLLL